MFGLFGSPTQVKEAPKPSPKKEPDEYPQAMLWLSLVAHNANLDQAWFRTNHLEDVWFALERDRTKRRVQDTVEHIKQIYPHAVVTNLGMGKLLMINGTAVSVTPEEVHWGTKTYRHDVGLRELRIFAQRKEPIR